MNIYNFQEFKSHTREICWAKKLPKHKNWQKTYSSTNFSKEMDRSTTLEQLLKEGYMTMPHCEVDRGKLVEVTSLLQQHGSQGLHSGWQSL